MGSERRVGAAALALLFALQIACQQFAAAQLQLPPVSRPSVQRLFGPLPQIGKGKPVPAGDPSFDSCAIPPWSNVLLLGSVNTTVYLGSGAFTGSQACGMCVAYRAPGEADVKYGVVGGWCPTCRSTDMGFRSDDDAFSIMGDMVWTPVQCDTGCGGLVYEMMDTPDDRMIAIKILQSRVPMYSVSVLQGDTYIPLQLNRQGFWTGEMELVSPTWQLQLVSVLGEQLTDVISILDGSNFMGRRYIYRRMQLPVNPEYASMEDDGGCLPATPAPTSPPPITTTPTATTTTPTVPETPGPTPGPTAPPSTLPPTPPPPFNPAELGSEFIPGFFEPNPNPPVITAPPANSSCGRCIEEELVQVCGRFGVPVYANLCFATVCEGVSPAAVSADNCRDTVPAPGSTPPSFDCSACLEFGFNPTCPPSGAPTYPNVCLAACAGVDVNTLSPEFCPPPPTPPPVTTTPAAIDCNSCFEFGMDNVTCAPGGFPFYWNTCFAECEGADLSSLSPANCDTAEPSTPAPASPTPQSFDCNSCGDFGFDPICPISGEPTYGNACLAFCSGADMSTLSPANCPGAVQPTTPPPTNNCSVCAVDGFDPVCPPSGEPIYGNPCFAACTGADLSALRPEFCPGVDPAPPPAPTMPPGVNCNSCASFGLNPVCPESGDVIYGNACLAACSGADSSMLRPEWCPPSAGVPRPTVVPTPTTTTPATTEPAPVNCDLCLAEGFDPVCPPSGDPLYGNLCIARCAGANLMELSSANCPTGVIPGNSPPPPPPLSTTTTASPPQTTTTPAPSSGASCAACSEQGFAPVCPSGGVPIYRNLCFATCIANVSPSEVTLENCGF